MPLKRQLHTIYLKHDSDFKTLSKKALAQVILKVVHIAKTGASIKQIRTQLNSIIDGSINTIDIQEALRILERERKIHKKNEKYYIHEAHKGKIQEALDETERLHTDIYEKYFSRAETQKEVVLRWFQDTTILFMERFSFEWFKSASHKVKFNTTHVENLNEVIEEVFSKFPTIIEVDRKWLRSQYVKFIDSEDKQESFLLWCYGISMFSSRLISAKNKADEFSVETFRNSKFILDTNVLMILDLEAHDLHKSLQSLETILDKLNIDLVYFEITRKEYIRAITYRKTETIKVFESYDPEILEASDCPFINTALKRGCVNGEDVKSMFEKLIDIPEVFHEKIQIRRYENADIVDVIEAGSMDEKLKDVINNIYKKRSKREKRHNPLSHDAGVITGAMRMRRHDKCWILTNDSVLKIYGIEHCIRDEHEIAIGLDVLLALLAVNDDANGLDASNFAPLFKNIIKLSLMPESETFQVEDLAFILDSNLKINELDNEKVLEIALEVKRMRVKGENDESISLYLRRVLERDRLQQINEVRQSKENEMFADYQRARTERQRDVFIEAHRKKQRAELRDKYEKEILYNRIAILGIPILILVVVYFTIDKLLPNESMIYQFLGGAALELVFGLLPLIPIRKRLVKRSSDLNNIESIVEEEIRNLKRKAEE